MFLGVKAIITPEASRLFQKTRRSAERVCWNARAPQDLSGAGKRECRKDSLCRSLTRRERTGYRRVWHNQTSWVAVLVWFQNLWMGKWSPQNKGCRIFTEISQNHVDRELCELYSTFERIFFVFTECALEGWLNILVTESFSGTMLDKWRLCWNDCFCDFPPFQFFLLSPSSGLLISTFCCTDIWTDSLENHTLVLVIFARNELFFKTFSNKKAIVSIEAAHPFTTHFSPYFSVFSDAERSDCASKDDPSVNYIRNSSRRGQMNDQTFAAGFLRISENETMPSPTRLFHWDTYTMYGKDQEHEFPVYLLDINGFGVNVFVQIETTAPLPTRRRSKKRSQKKASERRSSKQTTVSDGYVLLVND